MGILVNNDVASKKIIEWSLGIAVFYILFLNCQLSFMCDLGNGKALVRTVFTYDSSAIVELSRPETIILIL